MNKKVLILDLDNTIYPVSSIGEELFKPLLQLISTNGGFSGEFEKIKGEIFRKPFQKVASDYNFSNELVNKGIQLLKTLTYEKEISLFDDYTEIKKLPCKKFLVTSGFTKMQQSKIKNLGIENDFEEIHIIDNVKIALTKKDVFKDILARYQFSENDVLIIGDDPASEIKAAEELGIDFVLYDKIKMNENLDIPNKIDNYKDLLKFVY